MKTINNYAKLVKAQHALNKTLAPVETDLTGASQDYAKGAKFIYNGIMNQAKTDIAQGDALVLNTNYEAAPDVETQIANEAATRSALGAKNLVDIADFTLVKSSDRTKTINAADIEDIPSTQVILSFDVTNSDLTQDGAFRAYGPSVGGSRTLIGDTSFKSNGTYELSFDATTFDQFYIFIDNSDSENATCTISNIMIRLASDPSTEYAPYAMTNRELTEKSIKNELYYELASSTYSTIYTAIKELLTRINSDGYVPKISDRVCGVMRWVGQATMFFEVTRSENDRLLFSVVEYYRIHTGLFTPSTSGFSLYSYSGTQVTS